MNKDLELWQFIRDRIRSAEPAMFLVVAESSGSSPGRPGYKMAVGSDGELIGSIGGGVMEVNLVERSRRLLAVPPASAVGPPFKAHVIEQVHQKNSPNASGMICSGSQTVVSTLLTPNDSQTIERLVTAAKTGALLYLSISQDGITILPDGASCFNRKSDNEFTYTERIENRDQLFIIGGGHCSLALSEMMSKLDFRITVFDDRPELNTIEKNRFADDVRIIESYENIGDLVPSGPDVYVVVMTLGYASDELVIRKLLNKNFKYFGVLGSKAKMATLLKTLREDGVPSEQLALIRTPIGLPINSRTPEEIAVSIAAEIISVKNA